MVKARTTRFTKSGQPVMGTTLLVEAEDNTGPVGWVPVEVVGKLWGRGGAGDLVGLIVEFSDGGRDEVAWPMEYRRI